MNKRGQGGSELRVQEKKGRMIVQRGEFANYLRKNSGVKGDATSSEIQGACSAKLEQCEWPSNA